MVTEAQHKTLIDECKQWYAVLALYRDTVTGIEHYHNQFHIQLINIHDLKHEIRFHINEADRHPNFGHRIPHHHIKEKFDLLIADLDKLEEDFHQFISQ
jgi:hypothetical protein